MDDSLDVCFCRKKGVSTIEEDEDWRIHGGSMIAVKDLEMCLTVMLWIEFPSFFGKLYHNLHIFLSFLWTYFFGRLVIKLYGQNSNKTY